MADDTLLRFCLRQELFTSRLVICNSGALATFLQSEEDWSITCTTRSSNSPSQQQSGLLECSFGKPLESGSVLEEAIRGSTHILSTIPPVKGTATDPVLLSVERALCEWGSSESARWLGYLSSTSVYGDWGGAWVNEGSELRASDPKSRGHDRWLTEQAWAGLHHEHGLPVHIFRLGGIYGPGRSALDSAMRAGSSTSKARRGAQLYTNRCHVYDICQVLLASMQRPRPGAVYNVVDDNPASRAQVMAYVQELLGGQAPAIQDSGDQDTTMRRLKTEEKRVENRLIKEELEVTLEFPTYREGLHAIRIGDTRPFSGQHE
ncbi:g3990 [Coccomyxa viridis]|uniref:G3990 protein n=1 Tax=Coccomyxa viridis TaxID=1274662 RepID=A0ABP1FP47_9CHLO